MKRVDSINNKTPVQPINSSMSPMLCLPTQNVKIVEKFQLSPQLLIQRQEKVSPYSNTSNTSLHIISPYMCGSAQKQVKRIFNFRDHVPQLGASTTSLMNAYDLKQHQLGMMSHRVHQPCQK